MNFRNNVTFILHARGEIWSTIPNKCLIKRHFAWQLTRFFKNLWIKQCISSHQIRFSEKIIAQFKTHQDSLTFEGVRRVLFVFVLYFPCAFSFKYPSKYLIKITPLKVSKSYRTLHQSFHSFAFCLLFLGTF